MNEFRQRLEQSLEKMFHDTGVDGDFSTVEPLKYRNLLDLMSRASLVFADDEIELYQKGDGSFFIAVPMSPWDAGTYALLAVPRTMAAALADGKITPADHDAIFG